MMSAISANANGHVKIAVPIPNAIINNPAKNPPLLATLLRLPQTPVQPTAEQCKKQIKLLQKSVMQLIILT